MSQSRDSGTGIIPSEAHPAAGAEDGDNSAPGEQYATQPYTQLGRRGRSGRRGRKRRPRSMGRYPYLTRLRGFLEDVRPFYALVSHKNLGRKLRQIHRVLQELKAQELVMTSSPAALGQHEIGALLDYMNARDGHRTRPLSVATQECLLGALGVFLEHEGNTVMAQLRSRRIMRPRRNDSAPLQRPSEEQIEEVTSRLAEAAAAGDLRALGVLGLVILGAYAGLRPKEARLANRGDLSTKYWELIVMHPKGEGSWGSPRRATIVQTGRQAVADFLDLRARELERRGIQDDKDLPLVPCFRMNGTVSCWSSTYALQVKGELEISLGLRFDFRMLRRAFGQNAIDRGARIDSVSVALGHRTTRTTETYYARRKVDDAFEDLEKAWSTPVYRKCQIEQ